MHAAFFAAAPQGDSRDTHPDRHIGVGTASGGQTRFHADALGSLPRGLYNKRIVRLATGWNIQNHLVLHLDLISAPTLVFFLRTGHKDGQCLFLQLIQR